MPGHGNVRESNPPGPAGKPASYGFEGRGGHRSPNASAREYSGSMGIRNCLCGVVASQLGRTSDSGNGAQSTTLQSGAVGPASLLSSRHSWKVGFCGSVKMRARKLSLVETPSEAVVV